LTIYNEAYVELIFLVFVFINVIIINGEDIFMERHKMDKVEILVLLSRERA
jgi:hypothetical protein